MSLLKLIIIKYINRIQKTGGSTHWWKFGEDTTALPPRRKNLNKDDSVFIQL